MRLAATLAAVFALALPAAARAEVLLPPKGKVFAGVTGGYDISGFERETRSHPAVFQFFSAWGGSMEYMFRGAEQGRSRLMIHISTLRGSSEVITPRGIARGLGDGYLLRLNRRIAESGRPVYIRLMAEMDGWWNPYCAFDASGRPRGGAHTTRWFRQAWRRTVIVTRGGRVAGIDARLRRLGLPPVGTGADRLPRPRVSFHWVPQVAGAPDIRRNAPRAYWPGSRYVDWVGTDFYSKFPNWRGLERFYRTFRRKPFAFGEWALWDGDDPGFVRQLFRWSRRHRRVRMLLYNQGKPSPGTFRLRRYPRGLRALRQALNAPWIAEYAPEYAP